MSVCSQSTLKKVISIVENIEKVSETRKDSLTTQSCNNDPSSYVGIMTSPVASTSAATTKVTKDMQINTVTPSSKVARSSQESSGGGTGVVTTTTTSGTTTDVQIKKVSHTTNSKMSNKTSTSSSQRNTNSNAAVCTSVGSSIPHKIKYTPPTSAYAFKCYVSHADSPFLFWIQMNDVAKELKRLQHKMKYFNCLFFKNNMLFISSL